MTTATVTAIMTMSTAMMRKKPLKPGAWSLETPKVFQDGKINEALRKIPQYGTVLRAKGIVPLQSGKWIQFDYVPGEHSQTETDPDYTGRLCVIGRNLDRTGLASLFEVS